MRRGQGVVELRRGGRDRDDEGEVEEQFQRGARAVLLARVAAAEGQHPRRLVPGRHARRVCRPAHVLCRPTGARRVTLDTAERSADRPIVAVTNGQPLQI